jgi:hypothetical protein
MCACMSNCDHDRWVVDPGDIRGRFEDNPALRVPW